MTMMPLERLAQERRHADEVQQVVHHGQNQHAQHGTDHRAASAAHARAADDDRRNRIHFVSAARVGVVHAADTGNLNGRRHRDQRAHQRVDAALDRAHVHAAEFAGAFVRADGEHLTAKRRMLADHVQDHRQREPVQDRQDDLAADARVGNLQKRLGHGGRRFLHALLRHAAADLHHAERRDERRHAEMRNQNARAFAQQHAEQNTDGDGDDIRRNTGDTQTGQQTGGAAVNQRHDDRADRHHRRADRQINAARNDDERHAQRDDAHARVVAQDVDPVSGKRRKPPSPKDA